MLRFPVDLRLDDGILLPPSSDHLLGYSDGEPAEAYLRQVLGGATDLASDSPELAAAIRDWPSRYHLTAERSNLFRALSLSPDARVLEIGSGCGAITRYLGENCAEVVAVEGSAVRARIGRMRCRDLANVHVAACDVRQLAFDHEFDIVTLIGVLEYAAVFAPGAADPFGDLLRYAAARLRPGGTLVVAIENQLGLKYFAGCGEDHGAARFAGVEGYPDRPGPQTFGRAELADLLARSGFEIAGLLLPFPDYKVPTTFVNARHAGADEARRYGLADWCRIPFEEYGGSRVHLFSDHLALAEMAKNGLLADHANSFLFVATKPGAGDTPVAVGDWVARRFNVGRHPRYRTETRLEEHEGRAVIIKRRLGDAPPADDAPLVHRCEALVPYHVGAESLAMKMLRALRRTDGAGEQFGALMRLWIEFLRAHGRTATGDGLAPEFVDCIPDNLLQDGDGAWHYVDREWSWNGPLDENWVLYRGLRSLWNACGPWIAGDAYEDGARLDDFVAGAMALVGARWSGDLVRSLALREAGLQAIAHGGSVDAPAGDPASAAALVEPVARPLGRGTTTDLRTAAVFARQLAETRRELADVSAQLARETGHRPIGIEAQRQAAALASELARETQRAAADHDTVEPEHATYDILVPVYNGFDVVQVCLDSLLRHTDPRHAIWLVDDASPDARIRPLLEGYAARHAHIHYHRLARNLGFPGAVNTGIALTTHDLVLVNSDTEFTPGWLARMDRCRRSDPRIHTVTPLSNNATICSVPQFNEKNALPPGTTPGDMARLVARTSMRRYPRVPTGVGFCMLVTRELIDRVGPLDMTFGRGYGEEVDWCQRAWALGLESVICDDAYVFHHGEVGFSEVADRRALQERNAKLVAERWPAYERSVRTWCFLNPLRRQHQGLFAALRDGAGAKEFRLLQVVHSYEVAAGTEQHTRWIAERAAAVADSVVLHPAVLPGWHDAVVVDDPGGVQRIRMNRHIVPTSMLIENLPVDGRSSIVERFFADVVAGLAPDVVHFQHLGFFGSLALPLIAREMGARTVVSLHDYFLFCPNFTMISPAGRFCGRSRAEGDEMCARCLRPRLRALADPTNDELYEIIRQRNGLAQAVLSSADALVAPSISVRENVRAAWGDAIADRVTIVPHGTPHLAAVPAPPTRRQLTVAFLGNLNQAKGSEVFAGAVRAMAKDRVRFVVIGNTDAAPKLGGQANVTFTGTYRREDMPRLLQGVDAVVIPSICPETYCLTLDEAQRMGVPVVVSNIGAMPERVEHGVTGLVFEAGNADALAGALRRLIEDPGLLPAMRAHLAAKTFKSVEANADEYIALYRQLLEPAMRKNDIVRVQMRAGTAVEVPPPVPLRVEERPMEQPADPTVTGAGRNA